MERILNAVVLSDVHLGTFGCQARELLNYLQSIQPEVLILNGDFIDGWQFTKRYFPPVHIQVIYEVMKMAMNGTKYIIFLETMMSLFENLFHFILVIFILEINLN